MKKGSAGSAQCCRMPRTHGRQGRVGGSTERPQTKLTVRVSLVRVLGSHWRGAAMNRFLLGSGLLGILTVATTIDAQEKPAADTVKLLTPATSLNLRSISDLQFSPDGARVAFTVTEPPKGERRARHIWLYDKNSGSVRQFTFSAKDETSPRWSPDGKQVAFF
jgi:tricorn protease-like protein